MDAGACRAVPQLSAFAAICCFLTCPRARGTTSGSLTALVLVMRSLHSTEEVEPAAGRAGSRGIFEGPTECQGVAVSVAACLGRGSKAGRGSLRSVVALLRGSACVSFGLSVCKGSQGERPCYRSPFPPAHLQHLPTCPLQHVPPPCQQLPGFGKASGPISLGLPTCVFLFLEACDLCGQGSSGSLTPWMDKDGVWLHGGPACGGLGRTCGEKEVWDGGGCTATSIPCGAWTPSPTSVPRPSDRVLPEPCESQPSQASALLQRNPWGMRTWAWTADTQGQASRPGTMLCHLALSLLCLPSPSLPVPHLVVLLHARQPFVGLGAGLRLLLLRHLFVLSQRQRNRHPGQLLPPDGTALLGVSTTGARAI